MYRFSLCRSYLPEQQINFQKLFFPFYLNFVPIFGNIKYTDSVNSLILSSKSFWHVTCKDAQYISYEIVVGCVR
jgi:hypothetical protein